MRAANLAGCMFPGVRAVNPPLDPASILRLLDSAGIQSTSVYVESYAGSPPSPVRLVRVWRSGARRWRWCYFGGYPGGGAMSRFARGPFAAQNICPRGAGPSGSSMPPAHSKSPFSFDDSCSTQPTRHPRSVRSSISMTSISILSLRPAHHHAFNVPGTQAAPARALPLDFANVPPRVACESQPVRAYGRGLRWRVTPSRRHLNAYYLLYHSPLSLFTPGAGVRHPILVILAALPLSLASASCQIVVVTDVTSRTLTLCEVSLGVPSVIYVRVAMFTIFSARNSHRNSAGSRPTDGALSYSAMFNAKVPALLAVLFIFFVTAGPVVLGSPNYRSQGRR
ncbi:hypothetical protein B0H13DRAFT_2678655 [Mycena leptocephala]|nr:hypothetical protein B0H13DRAFT_2678655 [Mycena leptocephala]